MACARSGSRHEFSGLRRPALRRRRTGAVPRRCCQALLRPAPRPRQHAPGPAHLPGSRPLETSAKCVFSCDGSVAAAWRWPSRLALARASRAADAPLRSGEQSFGAARFIAVHSRCRWAPLGAHAFVAALRDAPRPVCLARGIPSRREAETGADARRAAEPRGLVDRGPHRQRDDAANAPGSVVPTPPHGTRPGCASGQPCFARRGANQPRFK